MILVRILFIAIVIFLFFFGFLRLCFSKGYLTRERLRKWNRNVTLTFICLIITITAITILGGVDQTL